MSKGLIHSMQVVVVPVSIDDEYASWMLRFFHGNDMRFPPPSAFIVCWTVVLTAYESRSPCWETTARIVFPYLCYAGEERERERERELGGTHWGLELSARVRLSVCA